MLPRSPRVVVFGALIVGAVALAAAPRGGAQDVAPPGPGAWRGWSSDELRARMPVPPGARLTRYPGRDGWVGVRASGGGFDAWCLARLGRFEDGDELEAVARRHAGLPAESWKLLDQGRGHGAWTWYRTFQGSNEKIAVLAVTGHGPRGSYVFLLVTAPDRVRPEAAAIGRWHDALEPF